MPDPLAHYTPTLDRVLLFTREDMRRTWMEERLFWLGYWVDRIREAR